MTILMKRILLVLVALVTMTSLTYADKKDKSSAADDSTEIHWLSIDEVQVKMHEHPKKVYMDMYTDWCGWCKRMEATTFKNPNLIRYMNENYYCVRFNAERKDTIRFMGKSYYFDPQTRANTLAAELMRGQMSYPTSIYMDEMFQNPNPIPGYQDVPTMEMLLKFMHDVPNKSQSAFDAYHKSFKATWR